jgi:hypothetical protein
MGAAVCKRLRGRANTEFTNQTKSVDTNHEIREQQQ